MDSTRTISELKSAFVRSQVRILSESLEFPDDWRNYAVETEEGDLGEKVIEDVLHKVNVAAKQHNRVVYSSQAIHHVAYQIASLYWSTISEETRSRANFTNGVEKTADLSRHMIIVNLPLEIESQGASHEETETYQQLRERLASLDQQRQQRQRRLDQLRHLQRLLEPFKDPQKDIQPNLVTRDGALVQEVEKMRMLVARVGGRIAQQKRNNNIEEDQEYLLPGSDRILEALLDTEATFSGVPFGSALHPSRHSVMSALNRMKRMVGLESSQGLSERTAVKEQANPIGDGGPDHHNSVAATSTLDYNDDLAIDPDFHLIDPCAAIIEGTTPTSPSEAPFARGHRRRSTHVTRRDLEKFQKEVLGVENHASWYDEESGTSRINPNDPQLEELNRAFALADMSMNSGPASNNGPTNGVYSGFDSAIRLDSGSPGPSVGSMSRQSMSPAPLHPAAQVNGSGMGAALGAAMPMNAGHQMDLHHLYDMVLELADVLKNNREVTKNIVTSAEEIMKHGSSESASPAAQQINGEISAARISELERALAKEKRLTESLKREQLENTKLIGEYESNVGTMVEQIRNYCQNNNMHFLYQKSHYNNLLQAERDAHLESRLDRDYWHAQTMKCAEMIRTAHRLRSEEEELPVRIIMGLQNEVRAYRNALGMEAEKPDEEYGWEVLKDVPTAE